VVKVGMPYLAHLGPRPEARPRAESYVLYAPTWEGVDKRQQYSSLEAGYGEQLLEFLLEHAGQDVVFRPHPSTGRKVPEYAELLRRTVARFAGHPRFHVHADPTDQMLVGPALPRSKWARTCSVSESLESARWVVTDVSSIVSAAIHHACPFAIVLKPALPETTQGGLVAHAAARVTFGAPPARELDAAMFEDERYAKAQAEVLAARKALSSVEAYLEGIGRDRQLDCILSAPRGLEERAQQSAE
jgi:hypothetical protein